MLGAFPTIHPLCLRSQRRAWLSTLTHLHSSSLLQLLRRAERFPSDPWLLSRRPPRFFQLRACPSRTRNSHPRLRRSAQAHAVPVPPCFYAFCFCSSGYYYICRGCSCSLPGLVGVCECGSSVDGAELGTDGEVGDVGGEYDQERLGRGLEECLEKSTHAFLLFHSQLRASLATCLDVDCKRALSKRKYLSCPLLLCPQASIPPSCFPIPHRPILVSHLCSLFL